MSNTQTISVGHTLSLALVILDQNGNPMITPPAITGAGWTDTNSAAETLTASADGQTASAVAIAPGPDTINVGLVAGGVSLTGSLAVEVDPAPQVPSGVSIVATVS